MSERDKGAILKSLCDLPDGDKQFVLGYAAGRSASSNEEADDDSSDGCTDTEK